ncbi:hypothetical protein [Azorhizophilus paspali]|uniref:hypothetical protein n=1 Tax=Azorhizophilus paspali TaxID=69963 RepID=UPI00363D4411
MNSLQAETMLLAIGLQEFAFRHRHQIGGPAHSYWMFERAWRAGASAESPHALAVCEASGVEASAGTVPACCCGPIRRRCWR